MAEFPINKEEYLSFDALSMKQHIKDRLNDAGVFTDQNYEGSYISTIIDIVAYTFHVLMFYLNKNSTESLFSDAELYENMNRIVKLIDYKPIGNQTATLSFAASAFGRGATESAGIYTIPRYTYFQIDGNEYCFNEDISFTKTQSGVLEALTDLSNQKLLYQGRFLEFPLYTATGEENELVFLAPGDNVIIDHFNVDVYVKQGTDRWEEWESTPSLYLETSDAKKYEIRLSENMNYEIKFGNNINGKKLDPGDQVAIYYLRSNGTNGEVGVGALRGKILTPYNTIQYNEILADVNAGQVTYLNNFTSLFFDNNSVSTFAASEESVESIRENAPGIFKSQYRLVTANDYEKYVKTNFANLIHDVKVVNNWKYLSEQMKYYYDLGVTKPDMASRVLLSQVLFGDACNFNNVYVLIVPKTVSSSSTFAYLTPSQKELIGSSMRSEKTLTTEVIIQDPVYMATTLAISKTTTDDATTADIDNTELLVIKDPDSRRSDSSIKNDITNVFVDYFNRENIKLGQTININDINSNILAVNGVNEIFTRRKDAPNVRQSGVSMLLWNPVYVNDTSTVINDVTLPYFKYVYLLDGSTFSTKITIQTETKIFENIEY